MRSQGRGLWLEALIGVGRLDEALATIEGADPYTRVSLAQALDRAERQEEARGVLPGSCEALDASLIDACSRLAEHLGRGP